MSDDRRLTNRAQERRQRHQADQHAIRVQDRSAAERHYLRARLQPQAA
jgi:hypothetical protein